jgi:hypothetical protein
VEGCQEEKVKKGRPGMTFIACIGSRETPDDILQTIEHLGEMIAAAGLTVVSGNAIGADQAFAKGANQVDPTKVKLFLPWPKYQEEAFVDGNSIEVVYSSSLEELAAKHHPGWNYLNQPVRKLMTRNAAIIKAAHDSTGLVIGYLDLYHKGGGGTGHGWRIATEFGMELINLADKDSKNKAVTAIEKLSVGIM